MPAIKVTAIYEALRTRILAGTLPQGSRLVIRQIAQQYDTSDIPVREALRMLERDGLVEIIPYRGARVVTLTPDEVEEGYLIRGHLESLATRTAVGRLTEAHFAELERCMRQQEKALDAGDAPLYGQLNREFHETIFSASPHRRLRDLIDSVWDGQSSYQLVFHLSPDWLRSSYREHGELVRALRAEDAEVAAAIALEHKLSVSRALVAALRRGHDSGVADS